MLPTIKFNSFGSLRHGSRYHHDLADKFGHLEPQSEWLSGLRRCSLNQTVWVQSHLVTLLGEVSENLARADQCHVRDTKNNDQKLMMPILEMEVTEKDIFDR